MANSYFRFKQFTIHQDQSAMKVTTDGCLFGAWAAKAIQGKKRAQSHWLDIGTGTGLLSLMVGQQNPDGPIDAVEIDDKAADEARMNILAAGKEKQIIIHQQDILQYHPGYQYDIIFSNPPFYENELKGNNRGKNKAHHNEGLLFHQLLASCKRLLKEKGSIFLLLPYKREKELLVKIAETGFVITQHIRVRPAVQLDFFRILLELQFNTALAADIKTGELAVKDEKDQYTPDFIELLREYYLYL
jgi:tRNA1Val (adenine37-N6)-methyltransferase